MKLLNLEGLKFNRLLVLNRVPNKNSKVRWKCECECGNLLEVYSNDILSNKSQSCGCLVIDKNKTKKIDKHPLHQTWKTMVSTSKRLFLDIDQDWLDINLFANDVGERPSQSHSLFRLDRSKGYTKDNCKWMTRLEYIKRG